jgi:hypothetical protein
MARRSDKAKTRGVGRPNSPRKVAPTPASPNGPAPWIMLSVEKKPAPSAEPLIEALARLAVAHIRANQAAPKNDP